MGFSYLPIVKSSIEKKLDQPIFPFIKSPDWTDAEQVVKRKLAPKELESPWLAFGVPEDDHHRFVSELTPGLALDDLEVRAITTLTGLETRPWEEVNIGRWTALSATGSPFSSEKMLDPVFMSNGQDMLGCSKLLVAIPRRTFIYAADPYGGEEYLNSFFHLAWKTFLDDSTGHEPISPYIFEVSGGWVHGMHEEHKEKVSTWMAKRHTTVPQPPQRPYHPGGVPGATNAPPPPPPKTPPLPPPAPGQISVKNSKNKRGNYFDLISNMGGSNQEVLLAKLLEKMQDFVRYYRTRSDVSGNFLFNIVGQYTPFDELLEKEVENLLNRINGSTILHKAAKEKRRNMHFKVRYIPKADEPEKAFERDLLIPG